MELIAQVIVGSLIILILLMTYRQNDHNFNAQRISYLAMFLTLAVVISLFSMKTVILGGEIVFSFGQMPMMLLGASMGPWFGAIGGLIRDLIGLIMNPTSFPFLGFTLNKILVPLILALSVKYIHNQRKQILRTLINVYLLYTLTMLLAAFKLFENRWIFLFLLILTLICINLILRKYESKLSDSRVLNFYIGVILVELIVQGLLTPIWLKIMFKTPFILSSSMRLLKGLILIPVNAFIGGKLYQSLIVNRRF